MEVTTNHCPIPIIDTARERVNVLMLKWPLMTLSHKQEEVQRYFDTAIFSFNTAMDYNEKIISCTGRISNGVRNGLKTNSEFMIYNMYIFLCLYSDLNGSWDNFKDELKEICLFLWDISRGSYAQALCQPLLANEQWKKKYLDKNQRALNEDFHRRQKKLWNS